MSILIIDTSYHQKPEDINYDVLYSQIDGIIARIGYGTGAPGKFEGPDPVWERTYKEAKARGIPIGGYHYVVEYKSVDEQLKIVFDAIAGKTLELGFWADVEIETGAQRLTRNTVIEYVNKAKPIIGTGGIYTGAWAWNPIMGTNNPFSDMRLWVAGYTANYPPMPYGWNKYWLWQYTSSGRLNGYSKNLDMNRISDENWKAWVGVTIPDVTKPIDVPLFSQRDSRWASDKLGTSSVTIGAYGCLITAASMICKFYGHDTDPKRMNQSLLGVNGYASGNLLIFNAITDIYPDVAVNWSKYNTSPTHKDIEDQLKAGIPVIIQVDYNPATSALDQHWVVVIGKDEHGLIIADPIDGQIAYLSRYADKAFRMVVYEKVSADVVLFRARCITPGLNVRSTAEYFADNRNVVDMIREGKEENVYQEKQADGINWFRIGVNRWVSGHPKYMERIEIVPPVPDPDPEPLTLEERVARLEKAVFG